MILSSEELGLEPGKDNKIPLGLDDVNPLSVPKAEASGGNTLSTEELLKDEPASVLNTQELDASDHPDENPVLHFTKEVSKALGRGSIVTAAGINQMVNWFGENLSQVNQPGKPKEEDIVAQEQAKGTPPEQIAEMVKATRAPQPADILKNIGDKLATFGKEGDAFWQSVAQKSIFAGDPKDFKGTFLSNPSFTRAAALVAEQIPSLGAAAAVTYATGSPMAGAAFLGTEYSAGEFKKARDAGKGVGQADAVFAADAVVATLMQKLPLEALIKGEGPLKVGVEQGIQQGLQTVWSNLVAKIGYDRTQQLQEGIVESIIAGAGSGALIGSFKPGHAKKLDKDIEEAVVDGVHPDEINQAMDETAKGIIANKDVVDAALTQTATNAHTATKEVPAGKAELTESDKVDIKNLLDYESNMPDGERLSFVDETGARQFVGVKSGHSQTMQDLGVKNSFELLNKALEGADLTYTQKENVQALLNEYKTKIKPQIESTNKEIENARKDLSESEATEVFDAFAKEAGTTEYDWQGIPWSKEQVDEYLARNEGNLIPEEIKKAFSLSNLQKKLGEEKGEMRFAKDEEEKGVPLKSNLQAVAETKLPNNVTGEQALKTLENSGLSKEEMEFSGIADFLKTKDKLTKAEIADYIANNKVKVKTVVKNSGQEDAKRIELEKRANAAQDRIAEIEEENGRGPIYTAIYKNGFAWGTNEDKQAGKFKPVDEKYQKELDSLHEDIQDLDRYVERVEGEGGKYGETKYAQHTLPGGENYREVLVTMPEKDDPPPSKDAPVEDKIKWMNKSKNEFKSSHFDEPNILVHLRTTDRTTPDGKKILFVEEVQSDWHAKGKRQGYGQSQREPISTQYLGVKSELTDLLKNEDWLGFDTFGEALRAIRENDDFATRWEVTPENKQKFRELGNEYKALFLDYQRASNAIEPVANAPFKNSWHELALKQAIDMAVKENYDGVAFINGEQTAERYDLSKQVDSIEAGHMKDGKFVITANRGGEEVINKEVNNLAELENLIGKSLADKIAKQSPGTNHSYSGLDLKVGGEWAKKFYDEILPKTAEKYIKKWGGKVEDMDVSKGSDLFRGQNTSKFVPIKVGDRWRMTDGENSWGSYPDKESLVKDFEREHGLRMYQKGFIITPQMKKEVLSVGQPLFGQRLAGSPLSNERGMAGKQEDSTPLPDDLPQKPKIFDYIKSNASNIEVPDFKSTEEAIAFGEANKDNPEVIKALAQKRADLQAESKKILQKEDASDEELNKGFVLAQKAQFPREALEAAAGKGKKPIAQPGANPQGKQGKGEGADTAASTDEFAKHAKEMTDLDKIKPIEMPEMVNLAKELMGSYPVVGKLRKSLGLFYAGGDGKIKLNMKIFKDPEQAAKTLAHEIGHLADYLPEGDLKRGNLIGRLKTLHKFMAQTWSGDGEYLKNPELRKELIGLSKYWKPYDPVKGTNDNYVKYRESASELYADFVSVLLNDPGKALRLAPKFYNSFFENLDQKPDVKREFFDLQSLYSGNREKILEMRDKNLREASVKGKELRELKDQQKKLKKVLLYERIRQEVDDINYPIIHKMQKEGFEGKVIPKTELGFDLDEAANLDAENHVMLQSIYDDIVKPLEEEGVTTDDLHVFMFLNRVKADRSELANPFGFTPETATEQLEYLKKTLGEKKFGILEAKAKDFHDIAFKVMEESVRVGSVSKEMFENVIKPNKDTYVSFSVLDYVENFVPASIKAQVGTLKPIANTFTSSILKLISTNRLNVRQRLLGSWRSEWEKNFKDDISPSKEINIKGVRIFKDTPGKGRVEMLEDGKLVSFDTDPYIAESFSKFRPAIAQGLVTPLRLFNTKLFRPMFITYNTGFQVFNFVRDVTRTKKNLTALGYLIEQGPDGKPKAEKPITVGRLLSEYAKALPESVKRVRGISTPLIQEMIGNRALDMRFSDYILDGKDDEVRNILANHNIIKNEETMFDRAKKYPLVRQVVQVLEGIKFAGDVIETLPKIASYTYLKNQGMFGREAGYITRNYVGTPNYRKKGLLTNTTNEIFLFSNIQKEGIKSDYALASDPKTRGGYWAETMKLNVFPKILMGLAAYGFLGGALKDWFKNVSEYDKTNYIILPLGYSPDGRANYVRIPHDESGRFIAATVWKAFHLGSAKLDDIYQILSLWAGQAPSLTPGIEIPAAWGLYLSGKNPYDAFRGRQIIDDTTWKAGGWPRLKKMVQWSLNDAGFSQFTTYDDRRNTTFETVIQTMPVIHALGRVYKTSDYGLREELLKTRADMQQEQANLTLTKRATFEKYGDEFRAGRPVQEIMQKIVQEVYPNEKLNPRKYRILQKAFVKSVISDNGDPIVEDLLNAQTNEEKISVMREMRSRKSNEQMNELEKTFRRFHLISPEVINQSRRLSPND